MENMYDSYEDDVEIDILDLIKELLKHWKSIILCTVIFAALGCGISVVKMAHSDVPEEKEILTEAEKTEEMREAYKLLQLQYKDDVKLYALRETMFDQYSDTVDMLTAELKKFNELDPADEAARLSSIITISSLQTAVSNAKSMASTLKDMQRPEEPDSYEEFAADYEEKLAEAEAEAEVDAGRRIDLKYIIIGVFLGGFAGCAVWGMIYLFDGKLKTVSELSRYSGVNMLGAPDKIGLVAANVKNYFSDEIRSVLVTGGISDEELKAIADAISSVTGVSDIKAAGGLNYNADTAIMLSDVDAVVIAERLKFSKRDDVLSEITMVKNAGKKLIGVAV